MGTIEINQLRIHAFHGASEQERTIGNIFEVSIHLTYPIEIAMSTDDLSKTLNYAEVVETVKQVMSTPSRLLEHAVGRLHTTLLQRFPLIQHGKITIAKLSPPISAEIKSVAITYEW